MSVAHCSHTAAVSVAKVTGGRTPTNAGQKIQEHVVTPEAKCQDVPANLRNRIRACQTVITKLVRSTESRNEGQFPYLSFSERDSERSGRSWSGVSVEGRDVLPLQLLTSERSLQESGRDGDETDRLRSIRAHSWLPRSLFAPARLSHLPPKSTEGRIFLSGPNHLGNQDFWTLGDTSPDSA